MPDYPENTKRPDFQPVMHTATADPWANRTAGMRCRSCLYCAIKCGQPIPPRTAMEVSMMEPDPRGRIGRCRRHAPTMNGYPVVFETDWCGDHKMDETKL